MGVLERDSLEGHPALLCSVHTFGKAAGCHGAVICGSEDVKSFLLNYGRPIIYSTSLPSHSLVTIASSYETMAGPVGQELRCLVNQRVAQFRAGMVNLMQEATSSSTVGLVDSSSPIQAILVPGNSFCISFCEKVWQRSDRRVRLYPIRSPTVPKGQERVRIVIHSHNSFEDVELLLRVLRQVMTDLGYTRRLTSRL